MTTKKNTATKLRIAEATDTPSAPADSLQARASHANFQLLKKERIAREAREKCEAVRADLDSRESTDPKARELAGELFIEEQLAAKAEREVNAFAQANSELWKEATQERHETELAALRNALATNDYAEPLGKIKAAMSAFTSEIRALVTQVDTAVAERNVKLMHAASLAQGLGTSEGFGQDRTERIFAEFTHANRPDTHSNDIFSLKVFPRHADDDLTFHLTLGGMVK
jgi:hypothetical protein